MAIQCRLLSILACVILMQILWSCFLSTWEDLLTFLMICIIQRDKGSLDHRSCYELYHIKFAFLVIHVITGYIPKLDCQIRSRLKYYHVLK
jgi:hypothetical protein